MNDPFSPAPQYDPNASPSVGLGPAVADAPDHAMRMALLKSRVGMPVTNQEISRLATRQSLEEQSARENAAAGDPYRQAIAAQRSMQAYTVGGPLDTTLAQARVRQAQLATDPVALAKFQQEQELASYGLTGLVSAGTPEAHDALMTAKVEADTALRSGLPLSQVRRQSMVGTVPVAEVAVPAAAPAAAPVVVAAPAAPVDAAGRIEAAAVQFNPNVDDPKAVLTAEMRRRHGGRSYSLSQYSALEADLRKELTPKRGTRTVVDPLTQNVHEVEVMEDSLGNIYQRGKPFFKSAGPNKKIDDEFQKDNVEWISGDGAATAAVNLKRLREGAAILNDPSTVGASGRLVGFVSDKAKKLFLSNRTASAEASIASATVEALRRILGSQFTENEGKRILALTFDPMVDETENARRANALADSLENAGKIKNAAAAYFKQHGTIQGFERPPLIIDVGVKPAGAAPAASDGAARVDAAKKAYLDSIK